MAWAVRISRMVLAALRSFWAVSMTAGSNLAGLDMPQVQTISDTFESEIELLTSGEQAALDGEHGGLGAVARAEFLEDGNKVHFHGRLREA